MGSMKTQHEVATAILADANFAKWVSSGLKTICAEPSFFGGIIKLPVNKKYGLPVKVKTMGRP